MWQYSLLPQKEKEYESIHLVASSRNSTHFRSCGKSIVRKLKFIQMLSILDKECYLVQCRKCIPQEVQNIKISDRLFLEISGNSEPTDTWRPN